VCYSRPHAPPDFRFSLTPPALPPRFQEADALIRMLDVIQETLSSNVALQRRIDTLVTSPSPAASPASDAPAAVTPAGCSQCAELERRITTLEDEGSVLLFVKDAMTKAAKGKVGQTACSHGCRLTRIPLTLGRWERALTHLYLVLPHSFSESGWTSR